MPGKLTFTLVFTLFLEWIFHLLYDKIEMKDVNATLDQVQGKEDKKPPKKAKWHLGIRSQSKPQDIMNEVFKAMKSSGMASQYYIFAILSFQIKF